MVDIKTNLLKNRRSLSEKDYQKERGYLQKSVISLVVVMIIVIALSAWNLVLTSKLSNIEDSLKAANKEMQGLTQASAEQIYLKSRLGLVTGFLSSRTDARQSLEKVLATDIPGTHISKLAFEDELTLGVAYEASSSGDLNKLLTYYETDNGYFTQVVNKGITRTENASYNINMTLKLPKGGK